MDIAGANKGKGAAVIFYTPHGGRNQHWKLDYNYETSQWQGNDDDGKCTIL